MSFSFRMFGFVDRVTDALSQRFSAIEDRLARLEGLIAGPEVREAENRATALLAAGWIARRANMEGLGNQRAIDPHARPVGPSVAVALERLEALDPANFPLWKRMHEEDEASYTSNIEASCSHWNHKYARLFGAFVSIFGRGRLLDIGCGINGRPSYLAGYPAQLISGLDPRPSRVAVEFEYVQGFNEFLPWGDETFSTVVSGTSLDHVLSLDRALEEVQRVLAPGGLYVVWLASVPGSRPYAPQSPGFEPADKFHLFHFDRKWIEPVFQRYFSIEEVCVIAQPGFDHVFYCLAKKAP